MINDKATPEERQESRLLTHMRESLVNLTSKHERLTIVNEAFRRGIQEILDSNFDDANQIKSALQKLLSETINH